MVEGAAQQSFSPQLAAQVGLEEAVLYAVLKALDGRGLNQVAEAELLRQLPWCNADSLRVLFARLRVAQLIHSAPRPDGAYQFEFPAQKECGVLPGEPDHDRPYRQPSYEQKHPMTDDWQPTAQMLDYLRTVAQAGDYVDDCVMEFRAYYAASGEQLLPGDWANRLRKWVVEKKRQAEAQRERQKSACSLALDWVPESGYVHQLTEAGVEPGFITETLHEFRAYWHDRGEPRDNWNYIFQKYVRAQWARLQASRQKGCAPAPMSESWEPGQTCMDLITNHRQIDERFARDLVPEFRLYWMQRGGEHPAWDNVFLKWCGACWSQRGDGLRQRLSDQNFMDRLLDTDW